MLVGLLCVITGGINSSTKVHSFVGYVTLQYIPHTKQHIISHLTSTPGTTLPCNALTALDILLVPIFVVEDGIDNFCADGCAINLAKFNHLAHPVRPFVMFIIVVGIL